MGMVHFFFQFVQFHSLQAQILSHQNELDAPNRTAMASDQNLITDAGLALAIGAGSGDGTGIIQSKPLLVQRGGDRSGSGDGILQSIGDLVHAGDDQHFLRTPAVLDQDAFFFCFSNLY